jgi:hypothetical protein
MPVHFPLRDRANAVTGQGMAVAKTNAGGRRCAVRLARLPSSSERTDD